jgi:GTP-binding protein
LIESRVISPQDLTTVEWLKSIGRPMIIALTKVDKLRMNERRRNLVRVRDVLSLPEDVPIIEYSSETHEGRDALWGAIRARLKT